MFSWAQKRTNYWSKIRKRAPKVPDITCPAIDDVLNQLEKQVRGLKELLYGMGTITLVIVIYLLKPGLFFR